jgi:hypothetical protein
MNQRPHSTRRSFLATLAAAGAFSLTLLAAILASVCGGSVHSLNGDRHSLQ